VGRIAIHLLCLPEQQTIEPRKEILHGKESQEGRQESSEEGQVTGSRFQIWFCKGAAANRSTFFVVDPLPVLGSAGFLFTLSREGPARPPGSTGWRKGPIVHRDVGKHWQLAEKVPFFRRPGPQESV